VFLFNLHPSSSFSLSLSATSIAIAMAFHRPTKLKPKPRSPILFLTLAIAAIALFFLFSNGFSLSSSSTSSRAFERIHTGQEKYLYWGNRIDCPGKHCDSCEGLGHQESSLRCALEEAMFLQRYFFLSFFGFTVLGSVFVLHFISGFRLYGLFGS
jgi:hypothetical protein